MTLGRRRLVSASLTVCVIAVVLFDAWILLFPAQKYLMIHSDDAGLCAAVNEATIQAMEHGVVSSASIMVVCPGFEEIADYAIRHPEKDFGVHLVLTCDNNDFNWGPVLKESVPSLVQSDGAFWRRSEEVAVHAKADEVDRELRAQVQRALDRGIPITHLDHHMWVLTQRPDFFRIFVQLGLDFKLPIRVHKHFTPAEFGHKMQDEAEYNAIIEPLVRDGHPLLDVIETSNYSVAPTQKQGFYEQKIQELDPGIAEFVIHCSVNRPGMLLPGAADRREADFLVFTSAEIQKEIRQQGIKIVNWKQLVKMKQSGRI